MSLVAFVVAVIIGYFLYESYRRDQKIAEREAKTTTNSSRSSSIDSDYAENAENCTNPKCQCKTGNSVFRAFLRSLHGDGKHDSHDLIHEKPSPFHFRAFEDRFSSLADVTDAIRDAGLDQCRLILGIDFTASNEWQGRSSNKGYSLHRISSRSTVQNPYQHVISILNRTLLDVMSPQTPEQGARSSFLTKLQRSQHQCIHAYGFGDTQTKDKSTFPLNPSYVPCSSFAEVQKYYRHAVDRVVLDGPTSYVPIIKKAIEIVEETDNKFHVLVIIADGQFVDEGPTAEAIVEASKHPLSIVVIGVGDGPWWLLKRFDDWLPQRAFDNFQFVEYNKVLKEAGSKRGEAAFALQMLMEIPDQYKAVIELGYCERPPPRDPIEKHLRMTYGPNGSVRSAAYKA